jgi:hypothetical protein
LTHYPASAVNAPQSEGFYDPWISHVAYLPNKTAHHDNTLGGTVLKKGRIGTPSNCGFLNPSARFTSALLN